MLTFYNFLPTNKSIEPNIDTLETKNYPTPDNMHYNASGQIKIGQIAAMRWLAMHYDYSGIVSIDHQNSGMLSPKRSIEVKSMSIVNISGRKLPGSIGASNLIIVRQPYSRPNASNTGKQIMSGKMIMIR